MNPKVMYASARIGGGWLERYFAREYAEACAAERRYILERFEEIPSLPAIDEDDINTDER